MPILDHVSLELPANSLGLVFGRSGAGKTTLLSAIAGLATPSAGGIAIRSGRAGPPNDAVRSSRQMASRVTRRDHLIENDTASAALSTRSDNTLLG